MLFAFLDRILPCDAEARADVVAFVVIAGAVALIYAAHAVREARRQRAYRAALARRDWPEVNRMMGLKP